MCRDDVQQQNDKWLGKESRQASLYRRVYIIITSAQPDKGYIIITSVQPDKAAQMVRRHVDAGPDFKHGESQKPKVNPRYLHAVGSLGS
jgi:hypothetical protein